MRRRDLTLILVLGMFVWGIGFTSFMLYGPPGAAYKQTNMVTFLFFGVLGALPAFVAGGLYMLDANSFFSRYPEYKSIDKYLIAHSPEDTFLGNLFSFIQSGWNLALVSLILSMIVAVVISVSGQLVGGSPELVPGSISDSATLALALEPAVSIETLVFQFLLLMGSFSVFHMLLVRRGIEGWPAVFISKFTAWIVTTGLAFLYHSFRYGAAESAQGSVLMLFGILNGAVLLTNSVIPAYMIHGSVNVFSKAASEGIWSDESAVAYAVIASILALVALGVRVLRWSRD